MYVKTYVLEITFNFTLKYFVYLNLRYFIVEIIFLAGNVASSLMFYHYFQLYSG